MELKHSKFTVELNNSNGTEGSGVLHENDKGTRFIDVYFKDNGNEVAFTGSETVTAAISVNGILINESVTCTIKNSEYVEVPIDSAIGTLTGGTMKIELTIVDGTKKICTPFFIKLDVKKSLADSSSISPESIGTFSDCVQEVVEARGSADSLGEAINAKADSENVYNRTDIDGKFAALPTYEEGSGTLTPSTENKLKNASFTYQRLGNCVTVQIACTFLAYEQTADGTVRLNGLPFVCGNDLPPRLLNITSQKREVISAISYSTSALVLIFRQAESFTEDETLSFSITYKIK